MCGKHDLHSEKVRDLERCDNDVERLPYIYP